MWEGVVVTYFEMFSRKCCWEFEYNYQRSAGIKTGHFQKTLPIFLSSGLVAKNVPSKVSSSCKSVALGYSRKLQKNHNFSDVVVISASVQLLPCSQNAVFCPYRDIVIHHYPILSLSTTWYLHFLWWKETLWEVKLEFVISGAGNADKQAGCLPWSVSASL